MQQDLTLSERILTWLGTHDVIFYILSLTWGIITSLIGFIIMIPFLITGKVRVFYRRLYGIFPKCFGSGWGFSMGCFFFTAYDCGHDNELMAHECGHGLQNILWGPLMMFVIYIPSFIRFWIYTIRMNKGKEVKAYDSIWFEGQASWWGWNYIYNGHLNKKGK